MFFFKLPYFYSYWVFDAWEANLQYLKVFYSYHVSVFMFSRMKWQCNSHTGLRISFSFGGRCVFMTTPPAVLKQITSLGRVLRPWIQVESTLPVAARTLYVLWRGGGNDTTPQLYFPSPPTEGVLYCLSGKKGSQNSSWWSLSSYTYKGLID